jgi:hypothetical protein
MSPANDDAEYMDKLLGRVAERMKDDPRVTVAHVQHHGQAGESTSSARGQSRGELLANHVSRRVGELAAQIAQLWEHIWLPGAPPEQGTVSCHRTADNQVRLAVTVVADSDGVNVGQSSDRLLVAGWHTEIDESGALLATKRALTLSITTTMATMTMTLKDEPLATDQAAEDVLRQLAHLPDRINLSR